MIRIDIKESDFYNELSKDERNQYFYQKFGKYVPNIDNIYYTVRIQDDINGNPKLKTLFSKLKEAKDKVMQTHESVKFFEDLYVDLHTFNIYKYCLSCKDYYDIFIVDYLANNDTPRISVQIRAFGLWVVGWEQMLKWSYESVQELLAGYDCVAEVCYENRIDYCFHTNAIKSPEKHFTDRKITGSMTTTLGRYHFTGRMEKPMTEDAKQRITLLKDYFALGDRKSNYVFVRFYNKALEVVEKGYKAYFFQIWHEQGLISSYDKFCLEYAYKERNYDYIHKARLEFYVQYGKDEMVRKEFEIALADKNMTMRKYRELADSYMPEITTVMNCEFETKRKFYYYSDDFIETLPMNHRKQGIQAMSRLYKIIDNRGVFLDYLTHDILRFTKKDGTYVDWWERLRNVELNEKNTDEKLIRDYSHDMDTELMKRKFINAVAGNAVYLNKPSGSAFIEDLTDVLSNINDSDKYNVSMSYFTEDGELSEEFNSQLLSDYEYKKEVREKRIKNRKKKADQKHQSAQTSN